ncbi:MAG: formyltetrahydrofolate deformylase [Methylococcales bacterium]|nr:formyltetrahydrofolate deformylase [Methylococcales bacterium]MBT7409540.1 formyltetrahydrofolate deformylase [Methylococcales bacterium]
MKKYRVLIDAIDEKGLVYKISKLFFEYDLNVISNSEYVDNENNKFFMRSVVEGGIDKKKLYDDLIEIMPLKATVKIVDTCKKNIVILATKESHCLGDILIRYEAGELDANILCVIANYDILEPLISKFGIPFHLVSHEGLNRSQHSGLILEKLKEYDHLDYIVLAKYMRILPAEFVETYPNQIINIHHSFLPAFIGANPYKQAYERGVKIIGATAHFVSNNLDEGPIIEQQIKNVNHAHGWTDMRDAGRDVEKVVFSNAIKLALEDKIFIYGNKTIIF